MERTIYRVENLPDLKFVNYCFQKYSINRGVYNVIDQWFYERGKDNIHLRREAIIDFLEYRKFYYQDAPFGHGGLKTMLEKFYY